LWHNNYVTCIKLGKQHYAQSDQLLLYAGISPLLSQGNGVMPVIALF